MLVGKRITNNYFNERIGMVLCRFHQEDTASMAVYENHDGDRVWYTYHCFGCGASGHVPKGQVSSWLADVVRVTPGKAKPHLKHYWEDSVPIDENLGDPDVVQFMEDRHITFDVLQECNVRYNDIRDCLVWRCITEDDGTVQTAQARHLSPSPKQPKIINLEVDHAKSYLPRYAVIRNHTEPICLIVSESFCDGLALSAHIRNRVSIMTTLSTGFNQEHIGVVNRVATHQQTRRIILAFDTDKSGLKTEASFHRYLTSLGYVVVKMSDEFEQQKSYHKPYDSKYIEAVKDKVDMWRT